MKRAVGVGIGIAFACVLAVVSGAWFALLWILFRLGWDAVMWWR